MRAREADATALRTTWLDTRAIPLAAAFVRLLAHGTIAYALMTAMVLGTEWWFSYDEAGETETRAAGSLGSWATYDRLLREELSARTYTHAPETPEFALWSSVQDRLPRLTPPEDSDAAGARDRLAWSAVLERMSEKNSNYEWARRGALDCLTPLILGLVLVVLGAGAAGWATSLGPLPRAIAIALLVILPCAVAIDPRPFYAVDRSYASFLSQAIFVAAFAATAARISARAIADRPRGALFLASVKSSPAGAFSARARAIEAAQQLTALVPIVVTAAVFTRARAVMLGSTDSGAIAQNGLGDLMSSVIQATTARARFESGIILMLAVGFLTFFGHRLLRETVRALSPLENHSRGGGR